MRPRIDVHSHFLPPAYAAALEDTGHSKPDGMPAIPVSIRGSESLPQVTKLTSCCVAMVSRGTPENGPECPCHEIVSEHIEVRSRTVPPESGAALE